jgi:hypothetical protein
MYSPYDLTRSSALLIIDILIACQYYIATNLLMSHDVFLARNVLDEWPMKIPARAIGMRCRGWFYVLGSLDVNECRE